MRNPFKRDPIQQRIAAVKSQLDAIKSKRELQAAEKELETLKAQELYGSADPSVKARMDAEKDMQAERQRRQRASRQQQKQERRRLCKMAPEAMRLLAEAKRSVGQESNIEAVTIRAQESVLDSIGQTPFGFDLIAEYRNLFQVPTLIRELWPYKPTILRTLPMLDFARWICRVVYEECLTAKGLVKGKTNYICRGMRATVVLKKVKEKDDDSLDGGNIIADRGDRKDIEGNEGLDPAMQADDKPTDGDGKENEGGQGDAELEAAQKLIDEFVDKRNYLEIRRERRRRMMIEGEAFLWMVAPKDDEEPPEIAFIEPDFVRPPPSANQEDPHMSGQGKEDWSFGILTPRHQYWNPQKYHIWWNDNDQQDIIAADMFHTAIRERSNIKRCLPPMFAMVDDLIRMTLLRAALADASKFRASIGGVVKYEQASMDAIRNWEQAVGGNLTDDNGGDLDLVPLETAGAANIVSLAAGRDWVKGPDWPDIGCLETLYNWHIRAIAQAEQVPEWMVSGATADGSYASATTSESVSIIEFEAEQEVECRYDQLVLRRVLELAQDKNLLDKDFFDRYDIHVEGEDMTARDIKAETETAVLQVQNKLCSRATAQANLGFDPEREDAKMEMDSVQLEKEQADQEAAMAVTEGGPKTLGGQQSKEEPNG